MFTPLGLFGDIPCPQGQSCSLLTCIFSHKNVDHVVESVTSQTPRIVSNESPTPSLPPPKRIKLDKPTEDNSSRPQLFQVSPEVKGPNFTGGATNQPKKSNQSTQKLQSTVRAVSPPPKRAQVAPGKPTSNSTPVSGGLETRLPPRNARKESLNPRLLTKAPASHTVRFSILSKLHTAISTLNDKLARKKESVEKHLILAPNELITMALDEEEKVAKADPNIYSNVIKLRIVKLTKMTLEDWAKEVKDYLNTRYYNGQLDQKQQQQVAAEPKVFSTGLTVTEEIAISAKLVTPLKGLEQHGYVTKPPTHEEIEQAKRGVTESKGWEKCDRCGGRFQVFPGRREDGTLTSGGECTYHPARPIYPPKKQTDHITGSREPFYPCCNETVGVSAGCTKAKTHVFKVSEHKRLASILQFEETPTNPDDSPKQPVCFDCEMGYTTLGLELIRLTAVTWPEGKELLDVLVRPMGEVLDLNSRFSGVFPEHFANGVPYDDSNPPAPVSPPSNGEEDSGKEEEMPLRIVDSPAAARKLLFQCLQPETPLIGHAIDNDLNVCRIIHPTIIDTVLLYPHPRGLPIRMSLKALCRKHLEREIQTRGARGHDSKEDAVATGDLVRAKASERWKILKNKGWRIHGDKLIPPPGTDSSDAEFGLGPGAGQKRKDAAISKD
ncbi:hypothetical protein ASPZODRAFT_57339 [Penicilliopsis zonata CBS 506.65]|uniref:RNA exonuclease 3 n=1 Tax=Penicilliopsis zonata CBS 506.65 TaxID=1073090 RepID=A0A1L9SXB2_9EURO|nr:hypothetical protein ASPZODRAFT_57339 [Penicilliopsis zonata CBS 506.65]OJJ51703.1 hypothetical protein ASPZODRAFT_57339 [Penicilliopsis zonata CBS 506.65]